MRKIIFRGKTISGEWVHGNYTHIKRDYSTVRAGHYISNKAGAPFAFMIRPETVGQFTGLKDKKGKDINKLYPQVKINALYDIKQGRGWKHITVE